MLAQLLIAYTLDFDRAMAIELDTTPSEEPPPSLAMWANVLRFVGEEGTAANAIPARSGIAKQTVRTMLDCLRRHGWIAIDGDVIRYTARGIQAREAWPRAVESVERHWETSFGKKPVEALRNALAAISVHLEAEFPQYPMPAAHRGARPTGE